MKTPLLNLALWRDIKSTYQRYLSLMGIIAIGVLVLVGLMTVSPYMVRNAERQLTAEHTFDLTATSTYGFDEKDQAHLRDFALEHQLVYAFGRSSDLISKDGYLFRVESLTENISIPTVTAGRLPKNIHEIAIDADFAEAYPLDSTISFYPESDKWGMREESEQDLHQYTYTIVGHVHSMNYLDRTQKGTSTVGSGQLDGFAVVNASAFTEGDRDFMRLRLPDDKHYSMLDPNYKLLAAELRDDFKTYYTPEKNLRFERIKTDIAKAIADGEKQLDDAEKKLTDAHQEVADAESKLSQGRQDYVEGLATFETEVAKAEKDIADAEQEIADAHQKIADGEKQLDDGEKTLADAKKELDDGKIELDDAQEKLESGWNEWRAGRDQLDQGLAQYEAGKEQLEASRQQIADGEAQLIQGQTELDAAKVQLGNLQGQIAALQQTINSLPPGDPSLPTLQAQLIEAQATATTASNEINANQAMLDAQSAELDAAKAQLAQGEAELSSAYSQLQEGEAALAENLKTLEAGQKEFDANEKKWLDGQKDYEKGLADYEEAKVKLTDAKKELADGEVKLADGKKTLTEEKAKGERELADARRKINEGQRDLNEGKETLTEKEAEARADMAKGRDDIESAKDTLRRLKSPVLSVSSRYDHPMNIYFDNSERVVKMAAIFPVFLFAIALLVTLTTMTRMVDEKRMLMGTLKALGYRPYAIARHFTVYGASAAIIGSVIGILLGHLWLSPLIAGFYSANTIITRGTVHFYLLPSVIATVFGLLATAGVAFLVVRKSLTENASILMRPKVPKSGTRIFLERITPLWQRLNFSAKVTARNLFRYKQRFLMTVIGVAGCVALLFMGYALRGSLRGILDRQYTEISQADVMVLYDKDFGEASYQSYQNFLNDPEKVTTHAAVHFESVTSRLQGRPGPLPVNVLVPLDEHMDELTVLRTRLGHDPIELTDQGAVITEKLAELQKLSVGDELLLEDENGETISVPITGITENYALHYIYLTPKGFQNAFGKEPKANGDLLLYASTDATSKEAFNAMLTKEESIMGVVSFQHFRTILSAFINVLDKVVYVIIFLSSLLAIIVLYNLTNINIGERIRELSTVKVLGFYNREVTGYIFREVWILTMIGIGFGFLGGMTLHAMVLRVTESDNVMFDPRIAGSAFLVSPLIVLVITYVVQLMMQKRLRNVDMVEALKAIE